VHQAHDETDAALDQYFYHPNKRCSDVSNKANDDSEEEPEITFT